MGKKLTQEEAIKNLRQLHPSLNFSKFVYINNYTKSFVSHSDDEECLLSYKHLMRGVTSNHSMTTKKLVDKIKEKFGDFCDCSEIVYTGAQNEIILKCPIHGRFITTPNRYLSITKYPCPKCGIENRIKNQWDTEETFTKKSIAMYGNKFSHSKVIYKGSKIEVELIHEDHSFWRTPNKHLRGNSSCPICELAQSSHQEKNVLEFIDSLGVEFLKNNRTLIKPLELDVIIPEQKIAIEYNGLYYHSEIFGKTENYHLHKTESCEKIGYRLIHIFEDEWINKQDIVKSRIKHILGLSDKRLFARKLKLKSLSREETNCFLEETHIQGSTGVYSHSYGLVDGLELVACMTFCKSRFGLREGVELLRFSSKYSVVGGFSKLLSYFIKNNKDEKLIVSYSDRRWSQGEVYIKNGFCKVNTSKPGYDYFGNGDSRRFNRQIFMKHKLPSILKVFDKNLTEVENCNNNGFYRVWNCGMDKWELKLP